MFILLNITCVCATQDGEFNNSLMASEPLINEVYDNDELQNKIVGEESDELDSSDGENLLNENIESKEVYASGLETKLMANSEMSSLEGASTTTKLTAPNKQTSLTEALDGFIYQIYLKDKNGNALAGKKITFNYDGLTKTATTASDGSAKITFTANKEGAHNVKVTFAGDNVYAGVSKTATITLTGGFTKLIASDKSLYVSDAAKGFDYKVTLKTTSGTPLANKKVILTVNGNCQALMTGSDGAAVFHIVLDKGGTYQVKLKFSGTLSGYQPVTDYKTLKVLKISSKIIAQDAVQEIPNSVSGFNYAVTLKDKSDVPLSNQKITAKFNGKTLTATTNVNGVATFRFSADNAGAYDVTINYGGNNYYGSVTVKKTITVKYKDNPYGNKAKKAWINCDGGSDEMKKAVAKLLEDNGWTVYVSGTGPSYHYDDYFKVTSEYQVYITLYNGFCAGTMREAYSTKIQNVLKNKGVQLIPMWDTSDWTNPQGMAPYKYGDFSGYTAHKAWDDDFSKGDPTIPDVGVFFKQNNAKYCASPTAEGLVAQFLSGGYFALHPN